MVKLYVLPCAGYDRPGGAITRAVAERIAAEDEEVTIGSVASLSAERPGEMRSLLSSPVIVIDGCSMNCARKIAETRGARNVQTVDVTQHTDPQDPEEKRVEAVIKVVREILRESRERPASPKRETTATTAAPEAGAPEENDLSIRVDKFTMTVRRGYHYSDNDFWVSVEGDLVRVGATDVLQQMVSDIYYVELEEVGKTVELGDDAGRLESTKTAMEIIIPISGTIVECNERLVDSPELINESPYDEGWLYVMRPTDLTELELLKNAEEYLEYAAAKARKELERQTSGGGDS